MPISISRRNLAHWLGHRDVALKDFLVAATSVRVARISYENKARSSRDSIRSN